jgi:hypothetical protein
VYELYLKNKLPSDRKGAGSFRQVVIYSNVILIIEQVAYNKSSLLLKIIVQNAQTLQLFSQIIKTESIYKLLKCHARKLGSRGLVVHLKVGGSTSTFKRQYLDEGRECFIRASIHN